MTAKDKINAEQKKEIEDLRLRLGEAEDALRAIGSGEVDAFLVSGPDGEQQVFTLRGAEQPYRILVETMNEGAATLAADGTILYCNSCLAAMLQVPMERLMGTQLASYVAPEDRPLITAWLGMCHEVCEKCETTFLTMTGRSVPALLSCCTSKISGTLEISAVITDLTQQKRSEEIIASERLTRSIIEQAGEAIIVCDERGMVIRASRQAHELCGANPLLKPFNEMFPLRLGRSNPFSISRILKGRKVVGAEAEYRCSGKRSCHLLVSAAPLTNGMLTIGCVVTLTDISERIQTEVQLRESEERLQSACDAMQSLNEELQAQQKELAEQNQELALFYELSRQDAEALRASEGRLQSACEELYCLNEELESRVAERTLKLTDALQNLERETNERLLAVEALREKERLLIQQSRQAAMGEMIGNIAHQWRQPLNSLGLAIQQLLLFYDLGGFSREFLEENVSISKELIAHMSQTIDDFRNFFLPNKEKAEFKVTEAVAKTLQLVRENFKSQQISVEIITRDEPVIFGYQNEYAQVLLNILNNARDALMDKGTEFPKVTVTVSQVDGKSAVTIADNAGGIPPEILGKIFDPYFTTKGPQQGTGVGLFMSKVIIEKNMGGRLRAQNTADGAEFRIEV